MQDLVLLNDYLFLSTLNGIYKVNLSNYKIEKAGIYSYNQNNYLTLNKNNELLLIVYGSSIYKSTYYGNSLIESKNGITRDVKNLSIFNDLGADILINISNDSLNKKVIYSSKDGSNLTIKQEYQKILEYIS